MNEFTRTKACTKCGENKALDEYDVNRQTSDGRKSSCKACRLAYRVANLEKSRAQQAKYRLKNHAKIQASRASDAYREAAVARSRAYYAAHREEARIKGAAYRLANAEAKKASNAAYRAANRPKIRAYQIAYSEANREKACREAKQWMRDNPERVAEIQRRRRARKAGSTIGPVDVEALWTGFCGICGDSMDRTIPWPHPRSPSLDHIVPLSKGGPHAQENLRWACLVCNIRKGDRLDP